MSMKIQITQQDIDTGKVRDAFGCAIAAALKQEFAYEISVTNVIQIGKDNFRATPGVVRWFGDFDKGRTVKPITIETCFVSLCENLSSERSSVDSNIRRGTCGGLPKLRHWALYLLWNYGVITVCQNLTEYRCGIFATMVWHSFDSCFMSMTFSLKLQLMSKQMQS